MPSLISLSSLGARDFSQLVLPSCCGPWNTRTPSADSGVGLKASAIADTIHRLISVSLSVLMLGSTHSSRATTVSNICCSRDLPSHGLLVTHWTTGLYRLRSAMMVRKSPTLSVGKSNRLHSLVSHA